jgi:hypothetical protein
MKRFFLSSIFLWALMVTACSSTNELQPVASPTLYPPSVFTTEVIPTPTETALPTFEPTPEPEPTPTEALVKTEEATAPDYTASSSVTISDITVTLTEFSYDAASAYIVYCYTLPTWNHIFDRAPTLYLDGIPAPYTGGGTFSTRDCEKHNYSIGRAQVESASEIIFGREGAFRWKTQDENAECEKAKSSLTQSYPGLNFICNFSMAGYFTNLTVPNSLTPEQANTLIVDTIEQAVYGPWIIRIK